LSQWPKDRSAIEKQKSAIPKTSRICANSSPPSRVTLWKSTHTSASSTTPTSSELVRSIRKLAR